MLSVDEALARILGPLRPLPMETVPLIAAPGRVLAEDIVSRRTQPPADVSAMDGYAVRAEDVAKTPVVLTQVGEVPAGGMFEGTVDPGQTARIFTGASVPPGADTIVIQENTEVLGKAQVKVLEPCPPGRHIRRKGIDFSEGDVGLKAGRRLTARDVGLIAAMNVTQVPVTRRPKVAILATGDELVEPGQEASDHQIVSSSPYTLAPYIEAWGGTPVRLGIARDTPESLRDAVANLVDVDMLVTIGGASVGDHDLIQKVLGQVGLQIDFWKIAMKPGKPLIYGLFQDRPMLGLPGNPVSSVVCALLYLKPAIGVLSGLSTEDVAHDLQRVRLGAPLKANAQRQDYIRAKLARDDDGVRIATPVGPQDSSLMSVLAEADCLIVRPPFAPEAHVRDEVDIISLS